MWILDDQYQLEEADIFPMNKPWKSALAVGHEDHLIVAGGDGGESVTIEIVKQRSGYLPPLCLKHHMYTYSLLLSIMGTCMYSYHLCCRAVYFAQL